MKRILHFKNIPFKSSYNWFKIDIHQQLRPLTANYLAMFKVISTTISIYNRKLLSVCLFVTFLFIPSRLVFHGTRSVSWFFMVPGWFFMVPGRFSWFFMVPVWFFMVCHGLLWFFMVFHNCSWFFRVFHGFSGFFMVPGWFFMVFFMVFHVFSWFQVGFSWFFSKMYRLELYPGPTIQSRSAARWAAWK